MFKLTISVTVPELDRRWIEIPCPLCELKTPVTLGSIRLGDVIVCRGCHLRVLFPKKIKTYGELRQVLASKFAQVPA